MHYIWTSALCGAVLAKQKKKKKKVQDCFCPPASTSTDKYRSPPPLLLLLLLCLCSFVACQGESIISTVRLSRRPPIHSPQSSANWHSVILRRFVSCPGAWALRLWPMWFELRLRDGTDHMARLPAVTPQPQRNKRTFGFHAFHFCLVSHAHVSLHIQNQ